MKKRVVPIPKRSYFPLHSSAFALACGIFLALSMLLLIITIRFMDGPDVEGIKSFGILQSLMMILNGFINGAVVGLLFAWLYNKLL